ncbi:MAG: hypothetical protein HY664_07630 [Chloroflexi bacterium]|nr:hypothetical protein [Chloroflexota bacterium]
MSQGSTRGSSQYVAVRLLPDEAKDIEEFVCRNLKARNYVSPLNEKAIFQFATQLARALGREQACQLYLDEDV